MPIRRNLEVSDDVIDSENSIMLDAAENRLWVQLAVINSFLSGNFSFISNPFIAKNWASSSALVGTDPSVRNKESKVYSNKDFSSKDWSGKTR